MGHAQVMHGWTMEAFDMLLEAWVTIVQDPMLAPSDMPGAGDTTAGPHFEMQVRPPSFLIKPRGWISR